MEDAQTVFRKSIRLLVGNVVGVGLFGLPYVFAQGGVGIGGLALLLAGFMSVVALMMYADMALHTKGHARFVGLMREHGGPGTGFVAAIATFGSLLGAMTAYILIGGTFLHTLVAPFMGGTLMTYRVIFFVLASIGVLGGTLTVISLQRWFIGLYTALILVLAMIAVPHIDTSHFTVIREGGNWLAVFGVTLFAFTGFGAVAEMRDILGRQKRLLFRSILAAMLFIAGVYTVFTFAVVGVTGMATTVEAIRGLSELLGPWVLFIGSAIGLFAVTTAFMTHGLALTNTWVYDYRFRYLVGWMLAVVPPFILFLFGAKDFIRVLEISGGVGVGLSGLVLIYAYEAMRRHPSAAKRMLAIPQALVLMVGVMYVLNIILPFIG